MNEKEKFGEHELMLIYHPFTSQALRKALDHLRHPDGDFIHVLRDPRVYTTLQAIVAYDKDGALRGWSGVYKRPNTGSWEYEYSGPKDPYAFYCAEMPTHIIGVYVQDYFRGIGLGGRLKQEAIKSCVARGIEFTWQDARTREWVEHDKDGTLRRRW